MVAVEETISRVGNADILQPQEQQYPQLGFESVFQKHITVSVHPADS
jgi:hypothetical protein